MKTNRLKLNILLTTLVIFTSFFAFKMDVMGAAGDSKDDPIIKYTHVGGTAYIQKDVLERRYCQIYSGDDKDKLTVDKQGIWWIGVGKKVGEVLVACPYDGSYGSWDPDYIWYKIKISDSQNSYYGGEITLDLNGNKEVSYSVNYLTDCTAIFNSDSSSSGQSITAPVVWTQKNGNVCKITAGRVGNAKVDLEFGNNMSTRYYVTVIDSSNNSTEKINLKEGEQKIISPAVSIKNLDPKNCNTSGIASIIVGGQYRLVVNAKKAGTCSFEVVFSGNSKIIYDLTVSKDISDSNIRSETLEMNVEKTKLITFDSAIKDIDSKLCSNYASIRTASSNQISVNTKKAGACIFKISLSNNSIINYNLTVNDSNSSKDYEMDIYEGEDRLWSGISYCSSENGAYVIATLTGSNDSPACKIKGVKETGNARVIVHMRSATTGEDMIYRVKVYKSSSGGASGGGSGGASVDVPSDDDDDVIGVIDSDGLCNSYNVGFHPTYSPRVNGTIQRAAKYKVGADNHNLNLYRATDKCNNNTYLAICYDPVSLAPTASTVYYKVAYVNPFDNVDAFAGLALGATYDSSSMSKAVEAFALSMIQNHYDEINGSKANAVAAQIALRTYIYGNFVGFSDLQSGSEEKLYHYRGLFCTWANAECERLEWTPLDDESTSALNTAKSWWSESGAVGNKCLQGDCSGVREVGFEFNVTKETCTTENGKKKLIYEGTVKGLDTFTSNVSFIKVKELLCPAGLECRFYIGNSRVNVGTDIRGAGNTFKFEVVGDLCSLSSGADVGVKLDYFDPGDWHNAIVIRPQRSEYQRMLLINDSRSMTSDFVFGDASEGKRKCSCNNCYTDPQLTPGNANFNEERFVSECCNDPSVTDEDYARYCPDCTQVEWDMYCPEPPSSTDYGALNKNGDPVEYKINEGEKSTGGLDYDKCIMDLSTGTTKSDQAGNTYKLSSNAYCTIACKEDWNFTLPTYKTYANGINAEFRFDAAGNRFYDRGNTGRFFELNIDKVEGTRTCITSNIDINTFKTDLEAKNKAVIDAYNALLLEKAYKAQYDAGTTTNNVGCSCSTGNNNATCVFNSERQGWTCEPIEDEDDDDEDSTDVLYTCTGGNTSASDSDPYTKVVTSAYQYTQYRYDGTSYTATLAAGSYGSCSVTGNGSTSDNCNGNNCDANGTDASDVFNASHGDDDIAAKITAYNTAVAARDAVINAYNSCTNFTNDYKWNPVIRYNYDETLDMSEENKRELNEYNYFQIKDGTKISSSTETYCSTSANESNYSCQAYSNLAASSTLQLSVFESCPNGDGTYTLKNCTKNFYNNKNVRKTVTYSAAFEIAGVWYTENGTGKIVFSGDGTKPEGSYTKTGGERGKVLPINDTSSMASFEETVFGMGSYRLEFSNIGQYQDTASGGRLIGGTDGQGTKSVFAAMNLTSTNEGTKNTVIYSCSYGLKESQKCVGKDIILEIETIEICPNNDCRRPVSYVLDTSGDVGYFSRSISLNDLNPNNRDLGGNWVDTKGQMTMNAIEEKGNAAYESPEYSYTLTPSGIASIRNDSGDYSKFEVNCDEKGLKCESVYLSELDKKIGVTVNTKLKDADLSHQNSDDKFKLFAGTSWK